MSRSMPQPRYAIYFVPAADTPLYRFGSSVLGYDCYTGRAVAPIDGVDAPSWAEVVREPRVYGFHATLKPPFYLASGADEAALQRAVVDFAAGHPAVLVGDLSTRELGLFIALVPEGSRSQLDRLAHACVKEFDRFRAPLEAPERARRLASDLSSRQVENLDRWGYPYVFEDFRFHMTLTGALPPPDRGRAFRFLSDKFEQSAVMKSLSIDQIAIARQRDGSSPFQVMLSAPLGQSPSAPRA